jgi:hypothetical protein
MFFVYINVFVNISQLVVKINYLKAFRNGLNKRKYIGIWNEKSFISLLSYKLFTFIITISKQYF